MGKDYNSKEVEQKKRAFRRRWAFRFMLIKVVFGVLFVAFGFKELSEDTGQFLVGLILGAGLIVWGLVPYFKFKKEDKQAETEYILSTPIEDLKEKDEAEILAEKYYR